MLAHVIVFTAVCYCMAREQLKHSGVCVWEQELPLHVFTHYSYISGGWGWKDKDKWAELTDENA